MMEATSRSGRLGIFAMECQHRVTQGHIAATKSLGRPKDFGTIAAESVLNRLKQWHKVSELILVMVSHWFPSSNF